MPSEDENIRRPRKGKDAGAHDAAATNGEALDSTHQNGEARSGEANGEALIGDATSAILQILAAGAALNLSEGELALRLGVKPEDVSRLVRGELWPGGVPASHLTAVLSLIADGNAASDKRKAGQPEGEEIPAGAFVGAGPDTWDAAGGAANPYMGRTLSELKDNADGLEKDDANLEPKIRSLIEAAIAAGADDLQKSMLLDIIVRRSGVGKRPLNAIWRDLEKGRAAPTPEDLAAAYAERMEQEAQRRETRKAALEPRIREIAEDPKLVDRMVSLVRRMGIVDEESAIIATYLAATSRLNRRQALSLLRRGAPASGKNVVIDKVLTLVPAGSVISFSGGSAKNMPYRGGADDRDAFRHRIVYIFEAAAFASKPENESPVVTMVRTMLSEGRLNYSYVEKLPDGSLVTKDIVKDGPICCIVTTARENIDAEMATRLLVSDTDESTDQTTAVVSATFDAATHGTVVDVVLEGEIERWRDFQEWLELSGPFDVIVPFGRALAVAHDELGMAPLRVRRDVSSILAAIWASAIMHSAQRGVDDAGNIVAAFDDYRLAYRAFEPGVTAIYHPRGSPGVKRLVATIATLLAKHREELRAKREQWRKENPTGIDIPCELLDVEYVKATRELLKRELGNPSSDTTSRLIRDAVTAGLVEICNATGGTRLQPREALHFRLKSPLGPVDADTADDTLAAGMPKPEAVQRWADDPAGCDAAFEAVRNRTKTRGEWMED